MSGNEINRRDFLKLMGVSGAGAALAGCDMPSTVTLEEGKEEVIPYVTPEEYVIPGVGVWYASTCRQCAAACGTHNRVREGRVLKVEGNPGSPVNHGKLCQMGQAGLQGHYNPDRLTQPLVRKNGALTEASWDEALGMIKQHAGSGVNGGRTAWVTGTVSGHQAALVQAHLDVMGSAAHHYVHEVVNNAVGQAVNREVLGEAQPRYLFDKAGVILSFGADFLGAWQSPVHFTGEYAKFRTTAQRGVLVQVEPKMTLTGANADLWLAVRPGTEGVVALGIANVLLTKFNRDGSRLSADVRTTIARYDFDTVTRLSGVAGDRIAKVAGWLNERSPSLVLSGLSAEGQGHGYDAAAAAMLLNIILGNVGKTIVSGGSFPFTHLTAKAGNTQSLTAFADGVEKGGYDAVFFYNTNPVFTAPGFMALGDKLSKVPLKVVFTNFRDETAMRADVVLPIHSAYEEWGTHVPAYQGEDGFIGVQQPVMEPLYATTRGFGDVVLDLLKMRAADKYNAFPDYYAYLRKEFAGLPADVRKGAGEEVFWQQALQQGLVPVKRKEGGALSAKAVAVNIPDYSQNAEYPYHLIPSPRLGMWDGRHANLPWLQESPDQISKVVWESWAEIHPQTAQKLGVEEGDYLRITSDQGTIEAKVYIFKGIHPDAVAVPLGQGHEEYGRYAKGRGVNPLKILSPVHDSKTGELAMFGTRVKVAKAGRKETLVRLGGSEAQHGRKLVATITADVFRRTEGGGKDVV